MVMMSRGKCSRERGVPSGGTTPPLHSEVLDSPALNSRPDSSPSSSREMVATSSGVTAAGGVGGGEGRAHEVKLFYWVLVIYTLK